MLIDFHTHIFPDKVAAGAVASLAAAGGATPHTDGTRQGLLTSLREGGVDLAVNLPVLTKPTQFGSVLRFSAELNAEAGSILSFAGAHPAEGDPRAAMREVRRAGIRGIKIHPEYQDTFIDDDSYYRLLSAAKEEDLIVVTHAGVDIAYTDREPRCMPHRVARLLDRLGGYPKLVLAHLGGYGIGDEVLAHLGDREVYLDTAFVMPLVPPAAFLPFCARFGAERILFGTDSPWQSIPDEVKRFRALGLPANDLEGILYENAKKLLGI